MIKSGLWLELEAIIGFVVGLGLGSLTGQRTVAVITMIVLEVVLTPILSRANIPHFSNLQRAVVGLATAHLAPGGLSVLGGGGGGPRRRREPRAPAGVHDRCRLRHHRLARGLVGPRCVADDDPRRLSSVRASPVARNVCRMATRSLETDYLVVGAGAMGMAFTDSLIDHADVHVTLVDRRHAAGGHWQDAYPFVQLHQASVFYGVASTVLGTGAVQQQGPESGLQQRARRSEIQNYYDDILYRRFVDSGRVTFLGGSEYHTDGSSHLVTSRVSGETTQVHVRRRVVDATYLSPTIPATTPPPFGVADGVGVVAVNELAALVDAPSSYVIVGSGKTATDGIVWLLANGVQPDRIVWVRPREPWMLNRAVVQPDPAVALGLAADTMAAAAEAESLDDLFLRLEAAGVMLRIDTDVVPTMAKTPTLGVWELDLLRTIENVIRLGHIKHVAPGEIVLDDGVVPLAPDSLVVHCAASGLQYPPLVPIWGPDKIRLQTIRAGFPCFNAALAGFVEATRDDDRERNRLCPPNTLPDNPANWAQMQVRGTLATRAYGAEPDIAAWANGCALNPARSSRHSATSPGCGPRPSRLADVADLGLTRMADLAHEPLPPTTPHIVE